MKRFYIYLFAAFCTAFLGGRTGNFRELNDDLSGISDGDLEADDNGFGYRLQIVSRGFISTTISQGARNWPFQMTQNLNADMFSGYMHDPKTAAGRQPQLRLQPARRLEQRHVAVHLLLCHAPDLPAGADGTRKDAAVLCHSQDTQGSGHAPCDGLLRAGDIQPFRRPRQRIRARQPAAGLRLLLR